jgi:hypothetical protein
VQLFVLVIAIHGNKATVPYAIRFHFIQLKIVQCSENSFHTNDCHDIFQAVSCLPLTMKARFDPRSVHVEFVVDKVALGHLCVPVFFSILS